jgi:hypothetical protein
MIRAILIDATARTLRAIELPDDEAGQARAVNEAVGGFFEIARVLKTGDVLIVNEDTRSLPGDVAGFALLGEVFTGNGVVVGSSPPDVVDVKAPIDHLRRIVGWQFP